MSVQLRSVGAGLRAWAKGTQGQAPPPQGFLVFFWKDSSPV